MSSQILPGSDKTGRQEGGNGEDRSQQLVSEQRRRHILQMYSCVQAFHVTSGMMIADSKLTIHLRHYGGDSAKYALAMAFGTQVNKVLGLVQVPLLAAFSEARGRKALMILGAAWALILRTADFAVPRHRVLYATTMATSLTTATMQGLQTSIADLFPGDARSAGGAIASLQIGKVCAEILTPTLSASLSARSLRLPMLLSVLMSALELGLLALVPETLPEAKRVPLASAKIQSTNPLAFIGVFMRGPQLAALAVAHVIFYMTEPMNLKRTDVLVLRESLGWKGPDCGRYASMKSAFAILPGYFVAANAVRRIGTAPSFLLSGSAAALHHTLDSMVAKPWQQFAIMPLLATRGMSTASLNALLLQAGADAGMRHGELRGCLESLKNVTAIVCAPLWAWWYGVCLRAGNTRRFFAGTAFAILVQVLMGQLAAALPPPPGTEERRAEAAKVKAAMASGRGSAP